MKLSFGKSIQDSFVLKAKHLGQSCNSDITKKKFPIIPTVRPKRDLEYPLLQNLYVPVGQPPIPTTQ